MSKRLRTIIIAAAAALLLGAAVLIVSIIPQESENNNSGNTSSSIAGSEAPDASGYITVYSFDADQVRRIEVKNEHGSYAVKYLKEDEYTLEGMEEYEVDFDSIETLLTSCMEFLASKVIAENPTDLAPYGLKEPAAQARITYDTGEVIEASIGDTSSSGSRYVYLKGNDKIYLVPSGWSTVFEDKYSNFLDLTVVDAIETDEDGNEIDPHVKKISYFGKGLENPIILEENPEYVAEKKRLEEAEEGETLEATVNAAQFIFTSPFKADVSNGNFEGMQYAYYGLTAYDIYALRPTAKDLKACGLDDPYVTVEVVDAKQTIKIKLGNTVTIGEEEYYYAVASGKTPIYLVDAVDFSFFEEDMINYMSAIVVNVMIDDIDTLTVEHGKDKYVFETSGDGEELVVRWNGKKMSTAEYRDLYQLVMLAYCEESVKPGEYKGDAELKITYTYRGKEKVDVVEYVKVEPRKYLIRRNGSDLALVRSKYVNTLVYGVTEFINGRDVPSDY